MASGFFDRVYWITRMIPRGKVASYGQVALLLGLPRAARQVGWALHSMPSGWAEPKNKDGVPWWRVINSRGEISTTCIEHTNIMQRELLEKEGIKFLDEFGLNFRKYRWVPSQKEIERMKLPSEVVYRLNRLLE